MDKVFDTKEVSVRAVTARIFRLSYTVYCKPTNFRNVSMSVQSKPKSELSCLTVVSDLIADWVRVLAPTVIIS